MSENNIHLKNDIIDLIKFKTPDLKPNIVEKIKSIQIIDINQLRANSKLLIFLLTKSYYETDVFEKDYEEAIKLKKNVVILIMEKNINFLEYNRLHRIINICEMFEACRFNKSNENLTSIDTRKKFFNLMEELSKVSCEIFLKK